MLIKQKGSHSELSLPIFSAPKSLVAANDFPSASEYLSIAAIMSAACWRIFFKTLYIYVIYITFENMFKLLEQDWFLGNLENKGIIYSNYMCMHIWHACPNPML